MPQQATLHDGRGTVVGTGGLRSEPKTSRNGRGRISLPDRRAIFTLLLVVLGVRRPTPVVRRRCESANAALRPTWPNLGQRENAASPPAMKLRKQNVRPLHNYSDNIDVKSKRKP